MAQEAYIFTDHDQFGKLRTVVAPTLIEAEIRAATRAREQWRE